MFQKASKTLSRLRLALVGPSGSGKTYSALAIATGLGSRIAVIDTERGSASKYAGVFSFDTVQLETFHPQKYIDAILAAEKAEFDVLIIDSLSHAWIGKEGALDLVDAAAKRSRSGNTFNAWRDVTPLHNSMIDAILRSKCHVIITLRTKTEYVVELDQATGRSVPRKVGLAPVQRAGLEYETDIVAELDLDHNLSVSKSRCPELSGTVTQRPGADFGRKLAAWLSDGATQAKERNGNGTLETLLPLDQVRVLLDQAQSGAELRALLPRIRGLGAADQAKIRQRYADRREEIAHASNRQ